MDIDKQKGKVQLSAIIIVRNEAHKIRRCLEQLRWVDEIVVLDQSSVDNTVEICREFTDKIFIVASKGYNEPDRPVAAAKAKNEWILYVDADELVSPELKAEIESLLLGKPEYHSYYIKRKNIFLDKWIRGSGWYPNYVLRLYQKSFVTYSSDIHTDVLPLAICGYLKEHIAHYTSESLEGYVGKSNRYTSILALQAYRKGQRINYLNYFGKFFIVPVIYFFYKYILKRGFRDGLQGLLIAYLTFYTILMANAKLWEIQQNQNK